MLQFIDVEVLNEDLKKSNGGREMKSFKQMLALALVAGVLIGYAYYDNKEEQKKSKQKEESQFLIRFQPEDVFEIQLKSENSPSLPSSVIISRVDKAWKLTSPVADQVEPATVDGFLKSILEEKAEKLVSGSTVDWAKYGLDRPSAEIEISTSSGPHKIAVSQTAAFDGRYFVKYKDELFLGSVNWPRISLKSAGEWRDRRLIRSEKEITQITVTDFESSKTPLIELKKIEGKWKSLDSRFTLDPSQIDVFLGGLKEIRGRDFVVDQASPINLARYHLKKPKYELAFGEFKLLISGENENALFVASNQFQGILRLLPSDRDKIFWEKMRFRDRKEPFQFDLASVNKIRFQSGKQAYVVVKSDSSWILQDPDPSLSLKTKAFEDFVTNLQKVQAHNFESQMKKLGDVQRSIELMDRDGKSLFKFEIGNEMVSQTQSTQEGTSLHYVKTNRSQELMTVTKTELEALDLDQLFEKDQTLEKPTEKK